MWDGTKSPDELALEINRVLSTDLQAQLRCGICCSTLKDPVVPSCNHPYCKECIDMVFQRKDKIECPTCRQIIKKRSCVASEHLERLVQAYLQLARNFKRDLREASVPIPKEVVFLESQAVVSTQMMDSPMRDFVPKPQFALPQGIRRCKRKLPPSALASKMSKLTEDEEEEPRAEPANRDVIAALTLKSNELPSTTFPLSPAVVRTLSQISSTSSRNGGTPPFTGRILPVRELSPPPTGSDGVPIKIPRLLSQRTMDRSLPLKQLEDRLSPMPTKATLVDAEVQCSFPSDLAKINIRDVVTQKRASDSTLHSDIEALFVILPGVASILIQDQDKLCRLLDIRRESPKSTVTTAPLASTQPIMKVSEPDPSIDLDSTHPYTEAEAEPSRSQPNTAVVDEDAIGDTQPLMSRGGGGGAVATVARSQTFTRVRTESVASSRREVEEKDFPNDDDDGCSIDIDLEDTECVPATPSGGSLCKQSADEEKENREHAVGTGDDSFDADITMQLPPAETDEKPLSAIPKELEPSDNSSQDSSSMVISISRMQSRTDEELVHEFRISFPMIRIVDEVTVDCTHLVMMNTNGRICSNRSLKYAFAVAYRCEMLSRTWMAECVRKRRILPTKSFTLQAGSQSQSAAWQRSRAASRPLFEGKKFMLPPTFSDHHLVPRSKLMELVVACGGQLVSKMWEMRPPEGYIVFSPDSKQADAAMRYEHDTTVPVINADWILDCVSEYRIISPIDSYRVYKCGSQF